MSNILVPEIKLLGAHLRGLWCQACKSVWMMDLEKLPVKDQLGLGSVRQWRKFKITCPHCSITVDVKVHDERRLPTSDHAVETLFGFPVRYVDVGEVDKDFNIEFGDLSSYMNCEAGVRHSQEQEV